MNSCFKINIKYSYKAPCEEGNSGGRRAKESYSHWDPLDLVVSSSYWNHPY